MKNTTETKFTFTTSEFDRSLDKTEHKVAAVGRNTGVRVDKSTLTRRGVCGNYVQIETNFRGVTSVAYINHVTFSDHDREYFVGFWSKAAPIHDQSDYKHYRTRELAENAIKAVITTELYIGCESEFVILKTEDGYSPILKY